MAPARAPTGQNGSTVLGTHSLAETVRLGPLSFIRLVGSLGHTFPLSLENDS